MLLEAIRTITDPFKSLFQVQITCNESPTTETDQISFRQDNDERRADFCISRT